MVMVMVYTVTFQSWRQQLLAFNKSPGDERLAIQVPRERAVSQLQLIARLSSSPSPESSWYPSCRWRVSVNEMQMVKLLKEVYER